MSQSAVSKSSGDGTVFITDGSTPAKEFEVDVEDGDFTGTHNHAPRTLVYDRNDIVGSRKGKNPVQTGSFTVDLRQFTNAGEDTIIDAVEQTGTWTDAVSVAGPEHEGVLLGLRYVADGLSHQDAADHGIAYDKVFFEWDFKEGDRTKLQFKWTSLDNFPPDRTGPA